MTMANFEVSKKVYFAGVWRSQIVNDQLLQQISNQNFTKTKKRIKGSSAVLNLSTERLDIVILNDKDKITRTDQIPIHDVVELTPNKHAASCLLAIVRDNANKLYYIFTFRCKSDKDAGEIVQGYGRIKQRLSGEGYNTDIKPAGTNWTLQEKNEDVTDNTTANGHAKIIENNGGLVHPSNMVIETNSRIVDSNSRVIDTNKRYIDTSNRVIHTNGAPNGNVVVINTERQRGEARVYTSPSPVVVSETRMVEPHTTQYGMKEELSHLAEEVRDIKLMLNKSQGRRKFQKHYQYLINGPETSGETKHIIKTGTVRHYQPEQRPMEPRPSYREDYSYVQNAPQVRHHRSTKSVSSSIHSGYSKRTYDSVNPALEQHRVYTNRGPRSTGVKYVLTHGKSDNVDLGFRFANDKVNKNIENVYGRRSYRYKPASQRTSEYIRVTSPPPVQTEMVHPTEEKVKQFIEEKSTHEEQRQTMYDTEVRHIYENKDFTNEVVPESYHTTSINQRSETIVVEAPRSDPIIIEAPRAEPIRVEAPRSTVYESTQVFGEENYGDPDTIVIRADTDVYKSTNVGHADGPYHTTRTVEVPANDVYQDTRVVTVPSSTGEVPTIYNNTVYHIKAEGMDSIHAGENAMGYQMHEIDDTRAPEVHAVAPEPSNDGLWESYAERPDENAGRESIEKVIAYRYHENDGIGDGEPNIAVVEAEKEGKRVHYMEELEQTIDDAHDDNLDETDHAIKNELDVITQQDEAFNGDINGDHNENGDDKDVNEGNDEEQYVIDQDELAKFSQEPNLVVIDREELQLY